MLSPNNQEENRSLRYNRQKYLLVFCGLFYQAFLLFAFLNLDISIYFRNWSLAISGKSGLLAWYLAFFIVSYSILTFPLDFYRSFLLERKFALSNQSFAAWLVDQLKGLALIYLVGLLLAYVFYYYYKNFVYWWLHVPMIWSILSAVFSSLFPLFVIPLFFKLTPLKDAGLKQRLLELAKRMGLNIKGVFEINLSTKTSKANAALTGLGPSVRMILADTLLEKYSQEEVEVVMAHELAHYKLRHLLKLLLLNTAVIFLGFLLLDLFWRKNPALSERFPLADPASLPLLLLFYMAYSFLTGILSSALSRKMEQDADLLSVKYSGLKQSFISVMEKLAVQNFADRKPHVIIKWLLFDHPPIDERISRIKSL